MKPGFWRTAHVAGWSIACVLVAMAAEASPTQNSSHEPPSPAQTNEFIPPNQVALEGDRAALTNAAANPEKRLAEVPPQVPVAVPVESIAPDLKPGAPTTLPAIQILSPTVNQVMDQPAATVVLQFSATDAAAAQVELQVNGHSVSSGLIGRTEFNSKTQQATQVWYGVGLQEGENILTARLVGTESVARVSVIVRGAPVKLQLSTQESRIPADGRSTATLEGQLLDNSGNRSNRDAVITLAATAGQFIGIDEDRDQPGFQIKATNGQFRVPLQAGIDAKLVQVRAFNAALNVEAFTQVQFEPNLRPSLVTGIVDLRIGKRGTNFIGSLRDFLPADGNNRWQIDSRTSLFATGKLGDWSFTGAFNSDRALNQTCDGATRLYRADQPCEQAYPTYGDTSTVAATTPSQDSLYLRLERASKIPLASPDLFLWGDYSTEEFAARSQQFTATTRQLHGFKANYNVGNLQLTAMYANNIQGFQRDTIAPDGTSGFYFLSRRLVVPGSETVAIELEEYQRPGTVVSRTVLNRIADYEIDYDRGTLLFRQPVLRTDLSASSDLLVRRIVVTYQYDNEGSNNSLYAARAQYHFSRTLNQESFVGVTYLRENQGMRHFELYGADALISLGPNAQVVAEYARSQNNLETAQLISGSAYRLEFTGQIAPNILTRAYYRHTDAGFSNQATTSFVPGQTRYGAQIVARVSSTTNLRVQYDHEDNVGIAPRPLDTFDELITPRLNALPGSRVDNSLTTISAGIQQMLGKAQLEVDWVHRDRQDRIPAQALQSHSDQLRTRFTMPITDRLTFLALNETTISASKDSVFTDRTLLGLNWLVAPGINLRMAQQFFNSGPLAGTSLTSVDAIGEYKLGPDTTINGRYSIFNEASGITMQGAIGVQQRLNLLPNLRMNLAYERVFGNAFRSTAAGPQFLQPYAAGQSAASLALQSGDNVSVGMEYVNGADFQANARYEYRTSAAGTNTVISAAATGKLSPSLTLLMRYQQASAANQTLYQLGTSRSLRLGLAYRNPENDRFNALLRYEYRKNPSTTPDSILFGSGTGSEDHTLAMEAIYAPSWRWELYGKYAFRTSQTSLATDLVGTSNISIAQMRVTYRLSYSWDVVGEGRWITQPSTGYSETGFGLEVGYSITPNLRAAVGYSSGSAVAGDLVGSGSRSASGLYVGLTVKVNELFDGFGLQRRAPIAPTPQETIVQQPTVESATPSSAIVPAAENAPVAVAPATAVPTIEFVSGINWRPADEKVLLQIVEALKQAPATTVELQGYSTTPATGGVDLAMERMMVIRSYLIDRGISDDRILIRSLPDGSAGNAQQAQQNRVDLLLSTAKQANAPEPRGN